jgi:GNAT superfamily N-acetyltransferase
MNPHLREIADADYAAVVLPQTQKLWAGRRDFDTYVRQTLEIARGAYGKRSYRTIGLFDKNGLLASFKRYGRTLRAGATHLRAIGIGAVYTPPEFRGRGYASAMLALLLDERRAAGDDLAYLFSDIAPQFYTDLGFVELPSRTISLRADALPAQRIAVARAEARDWPGIARCFEASNLPRAWAFERSAVVWNWIRMRVRHGSEHPVGVETNLVVRRGRGIAAYVLGVRAPEHDSYIVDEFGCAALDDIGILAPLLRNAAGDLRRIVGWLPPEPLRSALPRGASRKRKDAIFMAVPLSANGRKWLAIARDPKSGDGVWSTDHI